MDAISLGKLGLKVCNAACVCVKKLGMSGIWGGREEERTLEELKQWTNNELLGVLNRPNDKKNMYYIYICVRKINEVRK